MTGAGIEAAVRRAIIAAIEAAPELNAAMNGVFEPGAAGISAPYVMIGGLTARDWGTKDREGREVVATLSVHDARREGGTVTKLAALVVTAVTGMARSGEGIAIGSVRLRKSEVGRRKDGEWVAVMDFRVRALAV